MSIAQKYSRGNILALLFLLFSPFLLEAMHINKTSTPLESLWHHISWHFLGIVTGALAFPYILRGLKALNPGRRGKSLLILAKILICGFAIFILYELPYLGLSLQLPAFSYMAFLRGALLPLALMFFFHVFSPERHGKILGAIFACVEIVWFLLIKGIDISSGVAASPDDLAMAGPMHLIRSFLHVGSLWTALTALIIWATDPTIRDEERWETAANEKPPGVPQYRNAFRPGVVLAIVLCCYILRAILNNSLGYGIRFSGASPLAHITLGCLFIVAGAYIDKSGAKGMRIIVSACCFTFLMLPILPEVSGDGFFSL